MAFKPISSNNGGNFDNEGRNYPTPKDGSRKARVSLIIDLGVQKRDPIFKKGDQIVTEDTEGAVETPQKDAQQVVVFADLTADNVDYGGDIGTAPYRLLLNKNFKGVVQGINFQATPPTDAKGKRIEGKPWGLHPNNILTKLAKAIGKDEVITSLDIDELLNGAFLADVEVKRTEDKNGKKDKDGNVLVYTNVNFKGASKVPMIEDNDGNDVPLKVPALPVPAMSIQFDSATKDQIKYIRANLRKQIKLATNYAGSAMQKAIEAFEAEQAEKANQADGDDAADTAKASTEQPKSTGKKNNPKPVPKQDGEDDSPF